MRQLTSENMRLITLAAEIVSAYVSNNHVQSGELPKLLSEVHGAICGVSVAGQPAAEPSRASPQEIKRSVTADFLISFEDGKPYKTLRRHLTLRGLSPVAYRTKWGLDPDYPMTAQSYSEQRSQLARSLGLGQQRRKFVEPAMAPVLEPIPVPPPAKAAKKRRVTSKELA